MNPDTHWLFAGIVTLVFAMLSAGLILSFVRLARGPTLPDRVVALEVIATLVVGFTAVYAVTTGDAVFLDVAVVLALVAFIGAIAFASYLEKRGRTR
jgi:multicomponent Na+:H+ antiporter subunit F